MTAVSQGIAIFRRGEELERRCAQGGEVIEGARPRGAQKRFQFGEREFDRIEIGTLGRQKAEVGANLLNGGADLRCLWTARSSSTTTSVHALAERACALRI